MPTILITGVSRGIGRALAEAALAGGFQVVGTTRDGAAPFAHAHLSILKMDTASAASVANAAAMLDGPLDVIVNNAGIYGPRDQSLTVFDDAAFLDVLNVNVAGPYRVVKAFLPALKRGSRPRILMISSQMGAVGGSVSGAVAYRASKAAVNKMTQTLGDELRGDGIAVICCHPGWVRSDMGGSGADISTTESAAGLLRLIDSLDLAKSGRFFNWSGEEREF